MNRLIRNRDFLVIILLIVIICLFNFHLSHGNRSGSTRFSSASAASNNNRQHLKPKPIVDEHNTSQINSNFQSNASDANNSTTLVTELLTVLPTTLSPRQSFIDEIIASKDYRKICSDNKSPPINISLEQDFYFVNDQVDCPSGSFVVFLVVSHVDHCKNREKIRQSWASVRQLRDAKLRTLFFLYSARVLTEKQKRDLKNENDQYFDVVYIPVNISVKTQVDFYLKMYQFAVFSCMKTDYFVLINDGTFVNLPALHATIMTNKDSKTKSLICRVKRNIVALRNKKSVWYVSTKDWPEKHYPPHCDLSHGVIMSQETARDLLMCSFYEKRLWINDVFLTGVLPRKISIDLEEFMDDTGPDTMKNHHIEANIMHSIFLTDGYSYPDRMWRLVFGRSLREL